MEKIIQYILLFFIYSFLGWLMEVALQFINKKRFVNRGFLIGPICPIYGYGVLLILLLVGNKGDIIAVFLKSILICSLIEYFTSYFMEKLFKARWWDYSSKKFNINGRICLETMVPFGILGTLIIYILNPFVMSFLNLCPYWLQIVLAVLFLIIYLVDNIISFEVMNKIKGEIKKQRVDNTEVIRKRVTRWLEKNTALYRHIKNAFPKFQIIKLKNRKKHLKF